MSFELRDKKIHQRKLKAIRNSKKEELRIELGSERKYTKIIPTINKEARKYRKLEKLK